MQSPAAEENGTSATRGEHGQLPFQVRVRNRRKRYLDLHPEYFTSPNLELADPLLYDRLVRKFQSPSEREAEGRKKGYSGVLEADITRSEAKLAALNHPDPRSPVTYNRSASGEILPETEGEMVRTKEEGQEAWHEQIRWRFVAGQDADFDYSLVDNGSEYDDVAQERRDQEELYFGQEEPAWLLEDGKKGSPDASMLRGETGIQDF